MQFLDIAFDTLEENIAFDELLLNQAERGQRDKTLRFWEYADYSVITGKGCNVSDDVFLDRCKNDNIKIIQRISGGGTILLGKGCLNYSLITPYPEHKDLANIRSSFKYILGLILKAFKKNNVGLSFYPISDLALNGKKVSGNAQARKRHFILHHGTFLYNFDLERVRYYLKEPKRVPEYRMGRRHTEFLTNLSMSSNELKEIITEGLS